jgi:uncharacterized protein (TIGR03066 family)
MMRVLCSFVLCQSVVALPPLAAVGKKPATNAEKIVGTWEFVKSKYNVPIPFGTTFKLAKNGKLTVVVITGLADGFCVEGTYKVKSDKLIISRKGPDAKEKSDTYTIKKLTNTELVIEDQYGCVLEFKSKVAREKGGK